MRADTTRLRVLWLLAVALLLATSVWGRLVYWQLVQHQRLVELAAAYHVARVALPATRGTIYDRDMKPLAINTTVYDVTLAPGSVPPGSRGRVADELARTLGLARGDVLSLLESGQPFAYVGKREPKQVADQLRQLALPGVGLDPQADRTYLPGGRPDVSMASSLLGFVDYAGHGQEGIEQWYDGQLAGHAGSVVAYRDSLGRQIQAAGQTRQDPVDGSDLVLTIDSSVQYAAEQAIAAGVQANHATSGSVIVMDSRTGAIAAWASYPAYDANQFVKTDPSHFRDPILSSIYEPGSVMKVVTLSGALDRGRITPDTTFDDPGYVVVAGTTLSDWDHRDHGVVTMTNVLESSLNVGAVYAERAEGQAAFLHYLDAFGFGRRTGIDVADETAPALRSRWGPTELATTSYGQGVAVNMVQMVAAANVVANQGRWVQPYVAERIGNTVPSRPAPRQVISPQTAATMTGMMESVVQHGSGYLARVSGFEQDEAGKTGTSNMPDLVHGGYTSDVWASYVGFLPADDPQFTMLVVVTAPHNGSSDHDEGYYVSGPIWKSIAEQIVADWRITPGPPGSSN
ncbi:MAG TPA: penicillin-binding protein 2 [Candidatus Dormibacteraeota bacterium]|nr:penicillin-binding protein 2 [Candidatus Dormibacteraeota bacterium]